MALDSHLDFDMTLTWNWKFTIRNELDYAYLKTNQTVDLYIILR